MREVVFSAAYFKHIRPLQFWPNFELRSRVR